jgi:hypothetical protein
MKTLALVRSLLHSASAFFLPHAPGASVKEQFNIDKTSKLQKLETRNFTEAK